jgi:hypothetical protein
MRARSSRSGLSRCPRRCSGIACSSTPLWRTRESESRARGGVPLLFAPDLRARATIHSTWTPSSAAAATYMHHRNPITLAGAADGAARRHRRYPDHVDGERSNFAGSGRLASAPSRLAQPFHRHSLVIHCVCNQRLNRQSVASTLVQIVLEPTTAR